MSAGKLLLRLTGGPSTTNKGELTVSVEELVACRDEVLLQFNARNLDKKDFFGK